jgi:hypothetical protein
VPAARFAPGHQRRDTPLPPPSSRDAAGPAAPAPGGRALAIWVRSTPDGTRVQAARYGSRLANRTTGR